MQTGLRSGDHFSRSSPWFRVLCWRPPRIRQAAITEGRNPCCLTEIEYFPFALCCSFSAGVEDEALGNTARPCCNSYCGDEFCVPGDENVGLFGYGKAISRASRASVVEKCTTALRVSCRDRKPCRGGRKFFQMVSID